jgi:hypothetical protein
MQPYLQADGEAAPAPVEGVNEFGWVVESLNLMRIAGVHDAKARDLLQPLLGNRRAERLIDTVWQIEGVRDIRALRPLLRGGQR